MCFHSASEASPQTGDATAAAAAEKMRGSGQADVWEFTEGDLDNIGSGATAYGSDDDWSYASVSTVR